MHDSASACHYKRKLGANRECPNSVSNRRELAKWPQTTLLKSFRSSDTPAVSSSGALVRIVRVSISLRIWSWRVWISTLEKPFGQGHKYFMPPEAKICCDLKFRHVARDSSKPDRCWEWVFGTNCLENCWLRTKPPGGEWGEQERVELLLVSASDPRVADAEVRTAQKFF